jgi:hypothetical protein
LGEAEDEGSGAIRVLLKGPGFEVITADLVEGAFAGQGKDQFTGGALETLDIDAEVVVQLVGVDGESVVELGGPQAGCAPDDIREEISGESQMGGGFVEMAL